LDFNLLITKNTTPTRIENKFLKMNQVKIIASGKYLPQAILSSEIETKYNLRKGWSEKYSGVQKRHHVTFESNGYMGARAIEDALNNSELDLSDIDLIVSASGTFDYIIPNQSSIIKSELKEGLKYNIPTIDIDTTCLSFVTAFEIVAKILDGKQYKNIILVSAEVSSNGLNPSNPETLTLFGDAAAAFILTFDASGKSNLIKGMTKTYSEGAYQTIIEGGGNKNWFRENPFNESQYTFKMNGKQLLKLAKNNIRDFLDEFFEDLSQSIDDIDIIVPHQASKIGLMLFKQMYPQKSHLVMENLSEYGNCIAASIPLLLHQCIENRKIERGELCLTLGTSAGFSIGASLFKY